jgi:murein DD-endopeptidase MepM/ murein hydrolase activator NlpD
LQEEPTFVTVPRMPRASAHARRRRAETAAARRKRRLAGLILLASVALITLLLTAFGSGGTRAVRTAAPAPATRLLPAGPPRPQVVALMGSIRLLLPVAQGRLTAVGYHAAGDGSLALRPVGRQLNQGLVGRVARSLFGNGGSNRLRYYVLGGGAGPATASLDVGAPPGTDVYSPVDGRVVAITPYVLAGKHMGARIDIQPSGNPSLVVSLTHLRPDPNLTVGSTVGATTSKVGTIIDFAKVERQALAHVTTDAGNHVAIEVHAATLSLP